MSYRSTPSFAVGPMPHGCDIPIGWQPGRVKTRCDQPAVTHLDGDNLCQKHATQWAQGEGMALHDREIMEIQARAEQQAKAAVEAGRIRMVGYRF